MVFGFWAGRPKSWPVFLFEKFMRTKILFGGLVVVALVVAVLAEDFAGQIIRYRYNTILSVDPTVILKDEDGAWTNTWSSFKALAHKDGTGFTNMNISVSYLPTNAIAAWPTAPASRGGAALINSNGTIYLLTSAPDGNTWAATNKLAP